MKRFIMIVLLFVASVSFVMADEYVRGYDRTNKDGSSTHVDSYRRTTPNDSRADNYSTPGNYNPNTGRITSGDRDAYLRSEPAPKQKSYDSDYGSYKSGKRDNGSIYGEDPWSSTKQSKGKKKSGF